MDKRTILVGDVHGCAEELSLLAQKVGYKPGQDEMILVGDLVNRGPDSLGAWELFQDLKARSVVGNHELHLIRDAAGIEVKKRWIEGFKARFGDRFAAYLAEIRSWPLYLEREEFLVVHAGLWPGKHPQDTDPKALTSIRTWDGTGEDLQSESNPPWFDFYTGKKLVVFGHWAKLGGVVRPNVVGLDTGCVYGKKLTALVLPEKELVSVEALAVHCPITSHDWVDLNVTKNNGAS
ncbi:MAG: hypothetical protein A2600_13310 [Candidatus Lambdaproteobacteria bacterium RIFOXYD1_FULL_56_27]|uniref:Calcineurin-like phosphoesterase domain-containing protein n=1 Tax=Candidatus Lambdaproteobacteria bacterium RIFOXYD2_FULL_56_26 TaxID=1817773 RepID=A0A1F6GSS2_9PROT|nr:MAG: hypothetical protein A2557_02740 [Candidatus Lambdaproteobacteria bacterium RIFOXYD2_FULL_56_26]OGH06994.1 MAG: hypothetical protein A2600_13310 [Candidatus Lambdaproteobacteria bacterium RIFOXYD1_FULL_56_27]